MENRRLRICDYEKSKSGSRRSEQGFALVSLTVVVPLLLAVVGALGATFTALKRKSLAQSLCVREGIQLQVALKKPLEKLIKMNKQATQLRAARLKADQALEAATSSGYPPAIAAAAAARTAVILQQLAFRASQELLLEEARALRMNSSRQLPLQLRELPVSQVRARDYFLRALAVRPTPAQSLSPNYETVANFTIAQQRRFSFDLDVLRGVPFGAEFSERQKTECSISLKEEGLGWKVEILAARAPLS